MGQVEDRVVGTGASSTGTGLTYLNARYYDPATSRFISPDPLMDLGDPKTLDPYRYADNNPVVFTDASGLCSSTGSWGYDGGSTLEPPCNKSNGPGYDLPAPNLPDYNHGQSGWEQTGGTGTSPNSYVATQLYEKGVIFLADGSTGCETSACINNYSNYGSGTNAMGNWGDKGGPSDPFTDAAFAFVIGDDVNQCFSGSGVADHVMGCAMLGANFIPGVDEGKWALKGGGKLLKLAVKAGDDAVKAKRAEEVAKAIQVAERSGSGLKNDVVHSAPDWFAGDIAHSGTVFDITGGDGVARTLVQMPAELNGSAGRVEWILQGDTVTHQMFVRGGTINGIPIAP